MLPSLLVFLSYTPYNIKNYHDRRELDNENLCSI